MNSEDGVIRIELPFNIDTSALAKRMRVRGLDRTRKETAAELVRKASSVARPRALYCASTVRHVDDSSVIIGGTAFSSRVLSKVLSDQEIAFPYLITIGTELDRLDVPSRDMWDRYFLDTVKQMVLQSAGQAFSDHLHREYRFQRITHMNPGEIEDWPVTQQRPLFSIFRKAPGEIGVILTGGCMMKPHKSRSGICFANNTGFETCRLCTQLRCPGRRAAYDAAAALQYSR